jgi:hypothetical protein
LPAAALILSLGPAHTVDDLLAGSVAVALPAFALVGRRAGVAGFRWRPGRLGCLQIRARRRRSAFPTTETELRLIAAAAIIGFSRIPNQG